MFTYRSAWNLPLPLQPAALAKSFSLLLLGYWEAVAAAICCLELLDVWEKSRLAVADWNGADWKIADWNVEEADWRL